MQQKAQVIATLLHQPELLIIDEPFSGLDPLNTQMVKELLLDLHRQGVTIIMSSHQMHQVEEMCDRILLIDHGQVVLYGELDEIRRQYAGNAVLVHASGELPHVPGMLEVQPENSGYKISLARDVTPQDLLRALVMQNVPLTGFELAAPTLDEIFIQVVQGRAGEPQ
jgi:ABC-2 type transport system ATP-binding protein